MWRVLVVDYTGAYLAATLYISCLNSPAAYPAIALFGNSVPYAFNG